MKLESQWYLYFHVHCSTIYNSQDVEAKENMVYTYNGVGIGLYKAGNPAICDNMNDPWMCFLKVGAMIATTGILS